jgi:hypothetical protein
VPAAKSRKEEKSLAYKQGRDRNPFIRKKYEYRRRA